MGMLQSDDGFQLASDLEATAAWRPWLGDQLYSELRIHLVSPAAWSAFMRAQHPSSLLLLLQLKVRALLFDKAIELQDAARPPSSIASLQLQPDSVYFSLEHDAVEWSRLQAERAPTMAIIQAKYGLDSRDTLSPHFGGEGKQKSQQQQQQQQQRRTAIGSSLKQGRSSPSFRSVEHSKSFSRSAREPDGDKLAESDSWYDAWFDKHLTERMHRLARRLSQQKLPFPDQEALRRTPEGMATFLKLASKRQQDDSSSELSSSADADLSILPELTSISSCVPENPCPAASTIGACNIQQSAESASSGGETSVLSGLSGQLMRVGSSVSKSKMTPGEAETLSQQAVARILESQGFEAVRQIPMEILSELVISHIRKLGSWLRLLMDSYQKRLSGDELLRMFVQRIATHPVRESSDVAGGSLRDLVEFLKNERNRASQVAQMDAHMSNQLHQLHQAQSRNLAAFQRSMYLESALKKKQLASLRAKRPAEDHPAFEMKPYVPALAKQQPWIPQQIPAPSHSQVMQHLQQQTSSLHLPGIQPSPVLPSARMEGLHDILASDVIKQENSDDLDGALGSPSKRKRKEY